MQTKQTDFDIKTDSPPRLFVLYDGGSVLPDKLSRDSKLRIRTALELTQRYPDIKIAFVGGGTTNPDRSAGSMLMLTAYLLFKPEKQQDVVALPASQDLEGNVSDIEYYARINKIKDPWIVTTFLQRKRLVRFMKKYNIRTYRAIFWEAELLDRAEPLYEAVEYRKSWDYAKKEVIESLMAVYCRFDPSQKLVKLLRKILRRR